ncbi:hypothetical protein JCM15519_31590 [Fundidesulfovibrio butyratiphilus]
MKALKGGLLLCVLVAATALGLVGPAFCQDGAQDRPDAVMATKPRPGDTLMSGQNEQGDSVTRIEHTPKDQQGQTPQIGPIMVVPQVNQGGRTGQGRTGTTLVPVPVDPSGRRDAQ